MKLKRIKKTTKVKDIQPVVNEIDRTAYKNGKSKYNPDKGNLNKIYTISSVKLVGTKQPPKFVTVVDETSEQDVSLIKYNSKPGRKSILIDKNKNLQGNEKPQYLDKRIFDKVKSKKNRSKLKKNDLKETNLKTTPTMKNNIKRILKIKKSD